MASRASRESYYGGGIELDDGGVAGFVGILRQLGDLAQLAADVFQGLHDEAMATSQRGHHLALRLKQLDQHSPALHHQDCCSVCSCISHKKFEHCLCVASNTACVAERVQWRANVMLKRGVVAGGIIPAFIFERIHRCRRPPQLSLLDKFDPHGEGACLKRYTDPSFFRSDSACSTKLIQTTKAPPKVQSEASSQVNVPSTGSPEPTTKDIKACGGTGTGTASASGERSCELERTSSFEAWLSPNAPIVRHDENEITEEEEEEEEAPLRYACNNCKEDSNTYNLYNCNKAVSSKRSRYRGGVELIASRVSRLLFGKRKDPLAPADSFRYIPTKSKLHELEPDTNREGDIAPAPAPPSPDALLHVLTDHRYVHTTKGSSEDVPALAEAASVPLPTATKQSDDPYEACYDALLDEVLRQPIARQERNGSSVDKPCSPRSITQEHFGPDERQVLSTSVPPGNADVVPPLPPIPPMQWLSVKAHSGSRVTSPKIRSFRPQSPATNHAAGSNCLLPDPVMKQLETEIVQESILASHTEIACPSDSDVNSTVDISSRDRICRHEFPGKDSEEIRHQDSFRNCAFQPSEGEILKTRPELADKKSDPRVEIQIQRGEKHQTVSGNGDSDCNDKHKLSTEGLGESYRDLHRMGDIVSATHCNEPQVDAHNSLLDHHIDEEHDGNVHVESVFFSAVQQLTNMNPPSVPRPKYSLLEVRTTPGLIYPSRKLSGQKSILVQEMNDKVVHCNGNL
ncbi:hypothetical protein GUJ93_ZPchr0013g37674 [Zizania palustris]|uniref:Protein SCAR n=1 Tax=Zizania palustris TaxID=103762 RepID=A0A8J5X3B1_ZIZPA|nr:hypothetical protein GUJ93_ZPchr0013g37674 [Zizania palustris]